MTTYFLKIHSHLPAEPNNIFGLFSEIIEGEFIVIKEDDVYSFLYLFRSSKSWKEMQFFCNHMSYEGLVYILIPLKYEGNENLMFFNTKEEGLKNFVHEFLKWGYYMPNPDNETLKRRLEGGYRTETSVNFPVYRLDEVQGKRELVQILSSENVKKNEEEEEEKKSLTIDKEPSDSREEIKKQLAEINEGIRKREIENDKVKKEGCKRYMEELSDAEMARITNMLIYTQSSTMSLIKGIVDNLDIRGHYLSWGDIYEKINPLVLFVIKKKIEKGWDYMPDVSEINKFMTKDKPVPDAEKKGEDFDIDVPNSKKLKSKKK